MVEFRYPRRASQGSVSVSAVIEAQGPRAQVVNGSSAVSLRSDPEVAVAARVIVSLGPDGGLQMELKGHSALGNRTVRLKPGKEAEGLLRVLRAQAASRVQSGEDGAPTRAQVRHWEQHEVFGNSSCPFCISEGRSKGRTLRVKPVEEVRGDGSVKVRTVKAKGRQLKSRKNEEECGL